MTDPAPLRTGQRHRWWILAVLSLGQAMVFVDVSIVNVALPTIGSDLGIGEEHLSYVVTGYGATLGGLLILGGRLADLFGHRRLLIIGIVVFVLASLAAGMSALPAMLIATRVAQGAGAALLSPAALAVLNRTFPEGRARAQAFGIWGALGGLGAVAGVILGGVLTQTLGWRAIFLINAPIGLLVLLGIFALVPSHELVTRHSPLDVAGGVLMAGGLLALCFGLGEFAGGAELLSIGLLLIVAAVIALTCAVFVERRAADPLVPLSVMTRPGVRSVLFLTVMAFGTLLTLFFFASLYLNRELGFSPMLTGLAYLPIAVSVVIGSIVGARFIEQWGAMRIQIVAYGLSALGTAAIAFGAPVARYEVSLLPGFVIAGLGIGASFVALQIAVMYGVSDTEAGVVGGVFGTSQEAGGAFALAIATVTAFTIRPTGDEALHTGFAMACGFAVLAFLSAVVLAMRTVRRARLRVS